MGTIWFNDDPKPIDVGDDSVKFSINDQRTGFFSFMYNESLVQKIKDSGGCLHRDTVSPKRPGTLLLTVTFIHPETGQAFEWKEYIN